MVGCVATSWVGQHHQPRRMGGDDMSQTDEAGQVTGTKDKHYNIVWFTEQSLSNALRLETYISDAERDGDDELAKFFRKAQADSRKGGEQGKRLLAARLTRTGGAEPDRAPSFDGDLVDSTVTYVGGPS